MNTASRLAIMLAWLLAAVPSSAYDLRGLDIETYCSRVADQRYDEAIRRNDIAMKEMGKAGFAASFINLCKLSEKEAMTWIARHADQMPADSLTECERVADASNSYRAMRACLQDALDQAPAGSVNGIWSLTRAGKEIGRFWTIEDCQRARTERGGDVCINQ
jgi:hypothetical protein